jgi:hypothetical protein
MSRCRRNSTPVAAPAGPDGSGTGHLRAKGKAMDEAHNADFTQLDDFQVIAERRRVTETIATLADRYRKLNEEMTRRATLRWMLP